MTIFRTAFSMTVLSASLLGCKQHAPARPEGVPASAVWTGGADGGVFIDCTPSQNGEPNICNVYNDSTGTIYMSGKFVLRGQRRGAQARELKYDSADGNKIYLERNVALEPLSAENSGAPKK